MLPKLQPAPTSPNPSQHPMLPKLLLLPKPQLSPTRDQYPKPDKPPMLPKLQLATAINQYPNPGQPPMLPKLQLATTCDQYPNPGQQPVLPKRQPAVANEQYPTTPGLPSLIAPPYQPNNNFNKQSMNKSLLTAPTNQKQAKTAALPPPPTENIVHKQARPAYHKQAEFSAPAPAQTNPAHKHPALG